MSFPFINNIGSRIAIEFFSGSANVSKVLSYNGFKSYTFDNDIRHNPVFCMDVLNVEKKDLPCNVSFLWFSPPCPIWSRNGDSSHWIKRIISYRNFEYLPNSPEAFRSIEIINKVIEIISWFPDAKFVIENPVGRIHHSNAMRSLPHYRYGVNYFDFGFYYSKETYLFTNFLLPFSSKKVIRNEMSVTGVNDKVQRSVVPIDLVKTIVRYI